MLCFGSLKSHDRNRKASEKQIGGYKTGTEKERGQGA